MRRDRARRGRRKTERLRPRKGLAAVFVEAGRRIDAQARIAARTQPVVQRARLALWRGARPDHRSEGGFRRAGPERLVYYSCCTHLPAAQERRCRATISNPPNWPGAYPAKYGGERQSRPSPRSLRSLGATIPFREGLTNPRQEFFQATRSCPGPRGISPGRAQSGAQHNINSI